MTKLNNIIFTLFITFSIFNLYTFDLIQTLGKFGKTIIVPYIIFYYFYKLTNHKILKIDYSIILFSSFLLIGSINYIFYTGKYEGLIYSLIFISYLIYFYILIHQFKESYGEDFFEILIKKLKNIFLFNIILGFAIAIVINQQLWVPNKNELDFGGFLGVSLLFGWLSLSFFFTVYLQKDKNIIDYLLIISSIIFIFLSGGRGAQLALISFFTFSFYFKLKYIYLHYYLHFIVKLLLFIIISIIIYYTVIYFSFSQINKITTGRLFIWDISIKNIFYNNIFYFGYGINTYSEYLLEKYLKISYYFQDLKQSDGNLSLHSSYLTILSAGGIVSLLAFFNVIYKVIIKNKDYLFLALISSLLIGGIVEQFIMSPNIPISTLFWIVIIYILHRKENRE